MKKIIIFTSPLIILIELLIVTQIFEFLRATNDMQVYLGVAMSCGFIYANYQLYKYIKK